MKKPILVQDFGMRCFIFATPASETDIFVPEGLIGLDVTCNKVSCEEVFYIALGEGRFAALNDQGVAVLVEDAETLAFLQADFKAQAAAAWLGSEAVQKFVLPRLLDVSYWGSTDFGNYFCFGRVLADDLLQTSPRSIFIDPDKNIATFDEGDLIVTEDRKILVSDGESFQPYRVYDEAEADAFFGDKPAEG